MTAPRCTTSIRRCRRSSRRGRTRERIRSSAPAMRRKSTRCRRPSCSPDGDGNPGIRPVSSLAHRIPIRHPSLRRLLSAWALLGFTYFGLQTVLQNLYLLRLGYGPEFIGVLTGSGQLLWAICALPAAMIGRRFGLRGAIISGWMLSGLGNALVLLVELVPGEWHVPWLFFWWAVGWIGASLNSVNNLPYVMALASPEERNYVFVAQQGIQSLMAFAGSLAAGFLPAFIAGVTGPGDPVAPFRYTLWLAPPLYALIVFLLLGLQPAREPAHHAAAGESSRAPLVLLALFTLAVFMQTAS